MHSWIKRKLESIQKQIENNKSLYGMENWLKQHPYLWKTNKYSVSGGIALGLFIGFIPLPIQTILVVILSIVLRVNLPIAFLASCVINPFLFIPAYYLIFKTGEFLLSPNQEVDYTIPNYTFDWHSLPSYSDLLTWLESVGKLYLVGFPIISLGTALISYIIVYSAWTIYEKLAAKSK